MTFLNFVQTIKGFKTSAKGDRKLTAVKVKDSDNVKLLFSYRKNNTEYHLVAVIECSAVPDDLDVILNIDDLLKQRIDSSTELYFSDECLVVDNIPYEYLGASCSTVLPDLHHYDMASAPGIFNNLKAVSASCSTDETKPLLTKVYIHDRHNLAATNGYHLSWHSSLEFRGQDKTSNHYLDKDIANTIGDTKKVKMLWVSNDLLQDYRLYEIDYLKGDRSVLLYTKELYKNSYPDYEYLITKDLDNYVQFDCVDLLKKLKKLNKCKTVKFNFNSDSSFLITSQDLPSYSELYTVSTNQYKGNNVCFNLGYLISLLSNCQGCTKMFINNEKNPVIIKSETNVNQLLMPFISKF